MYQIIGGDQKEYGPVTAEQVVQWIREGRADGTTRIRTEESSDWTTLSNLPEFAAVLAEKPAAKPPRVGAPSSPSAGPEILARDFDLRIFGLVGEGWDLMSRNFGVLFGATAVFLIINLGMSVLGAIPILGILITLAGFVIAGPLMGGLFTVFVKTKRGYTSGVGDLFSCFSDQFLPLMLAYVVIAILLCLSAIPGAIMIGISMVAMGLGSGDAGSALGVAVAGAGGLLALLPVIYLSTCWGFTIPIIVDKNLHFWDAMKLSMEVVRKHWFTVFGFMLVLGIIYLLGLLCCIIGVFLALPIAAAAYTLAYDEIFA